MKGEKGILVLLKNLLNIIYLISPKIYIFVTLFNYARRTGFMTHRTNLPTKWNPQRVKQVFELALLGATDEEVARVMDVDINTINLWKRTHPEFLQSMNAGKLAADAKVAHSLYKRATGFWIEEMHVCMYRGEVIQTPVMKYYPPDSWAANKWMSIRQRTRWSEVVKIENTQTNININKFDFSGLTVDEMKFVRDLGMKQLEAHVNQN
jgi:hypothetical protein